MSSATWTRTWDRHPACPWDRHPVCPKEELPKAGGLRHVESRRGFKPRCAVFIELRNYDRSAYAGLRDRPDHGPWGWATVTRRMSLALLVVPPSVGRGFAAADRGGATRRRFDGLLGAANPDQRHDVGSRGLSPVASLVVTLVRAMVGSVFQTCNSRRDVRSVG